MISSFAALDARMLVPRHHALPFPFNESATTYYYLARNGIYELAKAWGLDVQEILVPAYCHGVEMQALQRAGATLRYYPVHGDMTVRVDEVASRVTSRTRAVYLIHYAGFPGPVEEFSDFCQSRGLRLIEDCALSLLSKRGDRWLGSFGDAAIFCLYKTLPLPNGGAVVVKNGVAPPRAAIIAPSLASTVSYTVSAALRRHHVTRAAGDDGEERHRWLTRERVKPIMARLGLEKVATEDFDAAQIDLAMSGVCHTVISAQDFEGIAANRRRNFQHLLSRLGGRFPLVFDTLADGVCPLFFPVLTPRKLAIAARMADQGIETVNFWANHAPGVREGDYPDVDALRKTVLELPCHQDLDIEDMDRIADEFIAAAAR